jgi:phosphoglycerate kinase
MAWKSIEELPVEGKRVFVRVDFNVPMKDGKITDTTRVRESLSTIRYLLERKARVLLASHLGKAKGAPDPKYSLAPVAKCLEELIGRPVAFAPDCIGEAASAAAAKLGPGELLLLENTRFHAGEEKNDEGMAKELASLAEVYVNDAFGSAHRAHASTAGIAKFLPLRGAGFLMAKELKALSRAVHEPEHPYVCVLGGAKISGKIEALEAFVDRADILLVGGGMANHFVAALGLEVGSSLLEKDHVATARKVLDRAKERGIQIAPPSDFVVTDKFDPPHATKTVKITGIPASWMAVDIGPATIEQFGRLMKGAKTIVWNGPMGVFEQEEFAAGTMAIAKLIAEETSAGAFSIVGGGESVAAVAKAGLTDRISHVSTGGGASLDYLSGKVLPGVAALEG